MYDIHATDTFKEVYDALDKSEKDWIDNIKKKLRISPTGKPLGFKWFREKKHLNKRLYFLVDEESSKILFVSFASKKRAAGNHRFYKSEYARIVGSSKKTLKLAYSSMTQVFQTEF